MLANWSYHKVLLATACVALLPGVASAQTACGATGAAPYRQNTIQPQAIAPFLPQPTQAPQLPQRASSQPTAAPSASPIAAAPQVPTFKANPSSVPAPTLSVQSGPSAATLVNAPQSSTPVASATTTAPITGQFGIRDGKIIGPDGKPFEVRGINVTPGQVDAQTLLSQFPGMNGVRFAMTPGTDPALIDAMVQGITSKGGVVLLEDHTSSGAAYSPNWDNVSEGGALAAKVQFWSGLAAKYANNPGVWFGTPNEPDNPANIASIATEQRAIYDGIRATGNNSIVVLEERGGSVPDALLQNAATYTNMKNAVLDTHWYPWPGATSDATIFATLGDQVGRTKSVTTTDGVMPVIIGEYGPSSNGSTLDSNAAPVIQQALDSKLGGFAWAYAAGADALTGAGGALTDFGRQVASYFASGK